MKKWLLPSLILFCLLFAAQPCAAADEADKQNEIQLDADSVAYTENTGIAVAEGNVKVRNKDLRLFAPYAEYDSAKQTVDAFSDSRNSVTLMSGTSKLNGKHLTYNLATRRGVMTQASGKMDAFYMKGRDVKVMPMEDAIKQGVVTGGRKAKNDDEVVAEWLEVTSTTCDFDHPHYRLVTKRAVIIPGKKVILKRPKFYIGKSLLFTYPFDYIARIGKREESLMPYIGYDSEKGAGFGVKGPVSLGEWGELSIGAIYWSKDIWEARLRYQKEITEGLSAYFEADRLYDKDEVETMWRPQWGLNYAKSGWSAKLYWAQRELIETEMRPGEEVRYNVWSDPEISFATPWFLDGGSGGKFRLLGAYGRYQENRGGVSLPWLNRLALGAEFNGAPDVGDFFFKPYYGAKYRYFTYSDDADTTQKVFDAWGGVRWNIGSVSFNSMYFWRDAQGGSPMGWDRYADNENIYQTITFPLPFGAPWEKWTFSVTGAYDLMVDRLSTMNYTLTYDKHCITWQLRVKDNLAGDDDYEIGLIFWINAYPENKFGIGTEEKIDTSRQKVGF